MTKPARLPPPAFAGATAADWYKDAIIYELRVRSFYDANGDGLGDFQGLAEKLDYLADLGVTALWILPFYPSPLRDDGYDIADYTDVHPELGTLADFRHFLREAHRRGLKVITELVLNHTSDQHPWFQRARRAPPGSAARDFYVWSDTADRYRDARVIFKDFEPSNWSWDPVAKAYFWHRFYAHQPDLNFDNPAVHRALLSVVDFWFALGVDGLRLDAVPYLYEREGTSCENLPETHQFLKKLRRHVDQRFYGRMLLAEANQWPEDSAAYFGQADECHMAFHFPIMPRIFMSIHTEDRFPIVDILAQTPSVDPSCQWALFLRNHDELTLEMVTDEERDTMYRAYAHEATMRINLGIRRRLAPLLGNDRRNVELMNSLLFSLPGTPVVYYGDEIGMGDNVYLGDRDGVRTPMQWSADKNAGFSRCNPQRLVLPIIVDPEYHYESVNVEALQGNPNSLLWFTKRLIALRKRYKALGRGSIEFLTPDNPRVLAFVRQHEDELILVVANLSRHVQFVELDLAKHRGLVPVELFGRTRFPPVGDAPYVLTLGGHESYWFALERPMEDALEVEGAAYLPPTVELHGSWDTLLDEGRGELERVLPGWLEGRRWFAGRGRALHSVRVVDHVPLAEAGRALHLTWVAVDYAAGPTETYLVPIAFELEAAAELRARSPHAIIATALADGRRGGGGVLYDAGADAPAARALLAWIVKRRRLRTRSGELVASVTSSLGATPAEALALEPRLSRESRAACAVFGDRLLLKLFRRMNEGTTELEVGRFLGARGVGPPVAGSIEWRPRRGEPVTIALLTGHVQSEGVAWNHAVGELRRYYERALSRPRDEAPPPVPTEPVARLAGSAPPPAVTELLGPYLHSARLLGRRTAELHLALASDDEDPAFAPEPHSPFDQRSLYQSMRNLAGRVLRLLRSRRVALPAGAAHDADVVIAAERRLYDRFEALMKTRLTALRTRIHGDYDLEQVLYTGNDFVVIEFEGDPSRPLAERRRKRSPLKDVAGVMRSLEDAALTTLFDETAVRPADRAVAHPFAHVWHTWVSAELLSEYLAVAKGAPFLPDGPRELEVLLDVFALGEALEELGLALEAGSWRARVPLHGLARMLRGDGDALGLSP